MREPVTLSAESGAAVGSSALVRRWYRAALARIFPAAFACWVNSERCWIKVNNDASGLWYVEIGVKHPAKTGRSLGLAMYRAFMILEADPEWQWTTDYLRSLHTPNGQAHPQPGAATVERNERKQNE